MSGAIVKIYSGVHLGAEIALKEGTWVFGRDDSADIIFADEGIAPRHAALTFAAGGIMRFEALDGTVVMATGNAPAGDVLPAAALWRLGSVLMAWGPEGVGPDFWREVEASVLALVTPAATAGQADASQAEATPDPASRPEAGDEAKGETDEPADLPETAVATDTSRARGGWGLLALVVILMLGIAAGVMTFSDGARRQTAAWLEANAPVALQKGFGAAFETGGFGTLRETLAKAGLWGELPGPAPEAVRTMLADNGFDWLKVSRAETGVYRIDGMVPDDRARAKLVEIARGFEWPVVLDVTVESDYTEAYRAAFNAIGFWPQVSVARTATHTDVTIAAYMISNVVEEKAFGDAAPAAPLTTALSSDMPVRIVRRIRHQDEVRRWVEKALGAEQIQNVTVDYLPGALCFKTTLTPEQKAKLDRAMAALKAASDVPLRMEVVNVTPAAPAASVAAKGEPAKKATRASNGPAFRVVAVSGGALKFVTLSNGTKVFQGGTLPGGYRLEAVHADRLVLSKDKKRINYPLKVKK